jgi:hypothetical protein
MFDQFWVSAPEFIEFREHNKAFESVGAYAVGAANLGTRFAAADYSERVARPDDGARRSAVTGPVVHA